MKQNFQQHQGKNKIGVWGLEGNIGGYIHGIGSRIEKFMENRFNEDDVCKVNGE